MLIAARSPKVVLADKLCGELRALALPGVRDYSIVGPGDTCTGVYCWDDSAPAGEYVELADDATRTKAIQDAIEAHDPTPLTPPPSAADQVAQLVQAIQDASSLDDLKTLVEPITADASQ